MVIHEVGCHWEGIVKIGEGRALFDFIPAQGHKSTE